MQYNHDRIHVNCPHCGKHLDCHHGVDPADVPQHGNSSICFNCHGVSIFVDLGDGLWLRKPTAGELDEIFADPDIRNFVMSMGLASTPAQAVQMLRSASS